MSTTDTTHDPVPIQQRRWARDVLKLAAAALIFGFIGAILVLVLRDGDGGAPVIVGPGPTPTVVATIPPTHQPTASPTAAPSPTATVAAVAPSATTSPTPSVASLEFSSEVEVGDIPNFMAVGSGSIWVPNSGDASVARVDPTSNTVVATIALAVTTSPDPEAGPYLMAVATSDSVWIVGEDATSAQPTLYRIDPATNLVVQAVSLEVYPTEIVYEPVSDSIWFDATVNNELVRLDPDSGAVVARLMLGPNQTLAVLDGLVWVGGTGAGKLGTIWIVDPATNTVTGTINDVPAPRELAGGEGAIWVSNWGSGGGSNILRIDPTTHEVTATIPATDPGYIGAGVGGVWFGSHSSSTVYRIDPATNTIVAGYRSVRGATFAFSDAAVWVAGAYGDTVYRIDP